MVVNLSGKPTRQVKSSKKDRITRPVRRRIARACDRCKIKKAKCDGVSPCKKCKDNDSMCTFTIERSRDSKNYYLRMHEMYDGALHQLFDICKEHGVLPKPVPAGFEESDGCRTSQIFQRLGLVRPSDLQRKGHMDSRSTTPLARRHKNNNMNGTDLMSTEQTMLPIDDSSDTGTNSDDESLTAESTEAMSSRTSLSPVSEKPMDVERGPQRTTLPMKPATDALRNVQLVPGGFGRGNDAQMRMDGYGYLGMIDNKNLAPNAYNPSIAPSALAWPKAWPSSTFSELQQPQISTAPVPSLSIDPIWSSVDMLGRTPDPFWESFIREEQQQQHFAGYFPGFSQA